MSGEALVQAAVRRLAGGRLLEEGDHGRPRIVGGQRFARVGRDLGGGVGQYGGRDRLLVREVPVRRPDPDARVPGDVVERRAEPVVREDRPGGLDQPGPVADGVPEAEVVSPILRVEAWT
nr:hypothetical protein [Kribbella qitaiheensis]